MTNTEQTVMVVAGKIDKENTMRYIKSKVKEQTVMDAVELLTKLKDAIIVVKTEHKSIKARLKNCDIYESQYGYITIDVDREV